MKTSKAQSMENPSQSPSTTSSDAMNSENSGGLWQSRHLSSHCSLDIHHEATKQKQFKNTSQSLQKPPGCISYVVSSFCEPQRCQHPRKLKAFFGKQKKPAHLSETSIPRSECRSVPIRGPKVPWMKPMLYCGFSLLQKLPNIRNRSSTLTP